MHPIIDPTVEQISPDPPPWEGRAILRQQWSELAYFHWPYEPAAVQRLLPAGLRVDTWIDGAEIDQTLIETAGLPTPEGAPHGRYSPGVDVRIAWYEKIGVSPR